MLFAVNIDGTIAGMIPNTDPRQAKNADDEDNGPDTEEIKHSWWWPF